MRKAPQSTSQRYPWVASAAWGWRLEIYYGIVGFIVLVIASRIDPAGPYIVIGAGSLILWKSPNLRHRVNVRRNNIRVTSRLERALWHCGIVGRQGDIPRVVRTAPLPVGVRYLLRLPFGLHELCGKVVAGAI